jgi:prophage DNA circulation protein
MSWRDHVGPARFRNVPFHVAVAEVSGGRRTVKHEFPGQSLPYVEDLGQKGRDFTVEGYVVGDDYLSLRDALLEALEAEGPGELVHPYHGRRRVAVVNYRVRESSDSGGMAVFSIEFSETPDAPPQPSTAPDVKGVVRSSASKARAAVEAEFLSSYAPGPQPVSLVGALTGAARALDAALSGITLDGQALATLRRSTEALLGGALSLAGKPGSLVARLSALLTGFEEWRSLLPVYSFDPGPRPVGMTAVRRREQASFDALRRLTQRLVVLRSVELMMDESFDSYDAGIAARNILSGLLDEQVEVAADDTYPALLQLRADLVRAVPGPSEDLPRLSKHTPSATLTSLVLAHQLYGELSLEADLISRNRISHPAFILGGRELEVLSHA